MQQDRRWEHFKCQRCGKCCIKIGLPYDPESIFKIAEFLELEVGQVIEKYYGKIVEDGKTWESEDDKMSPCQFLRPDGDLKSCAIYSVRPSGCRLYPFDTDFGRQGVECIAAKIVYSKLKKAKD